MTLTEALTLTFLLSGFCLQWWKDPPAFNRMDQNKSSSQQGYGATPPPYNSCYTGVSYQVRSMLECLCSFITSKTKSHSTIFFHSKNTHDFHSWLFLKWFNALCCCWLNQVGSGNIAVVSPPGPYGNMTQSNGAAAVGGQQYGEAPPGYCQGFEDSAFNDGAIRRGEGQTGSVRSKYRVCLFRNAVSRFLN